MTVLQPWTYRRARGAIHDLSHLETLSDQPKYLLCVSERTLSVLQNLAAADVTYPARYAKTLYSNRYLKVTPEDSQWELFRSIVNNLQLELEMSCEITPVLEEIRDAILAITNASVAIQIDNALCCDTGGLTQNGLNPAAWDDSEPPLDVNKCKRSWTVVLDWKETAMRLFETRQNLGLLGVGIISVIVAVLALPVAVIVGIAAAIVGATYIIVTDLIEIEEDLDEIAYDLACAIYSASSAQNAKLAVDAEIDGMSGPDASTKRILKDLLQSNLLNLVFDESLEIRPDAPSDCSSCEEQGCNGVYEFTSGLEGVTGPFGGPGDETWLWSGGPGYDSLPGRGVFDNPAPEDGNDCYLAVPACEEQVVTTGGTVSVRVHMPAESGNANNFYSRIYYEEGGYDSGNNVVGDGTWKTVTATVSASNNGKHVSDIFLIFYKYQSTNPCTVLVDHLVISL